LEQQQKQKQQSKGLQPESLIRYYLVLLAMAPSFLLLASDSSR